MRTIAAFLICCLVVSAAAADPWDLRERTLPNGLRVITLEDRSCPIVAVQLWYHVGSKDEQGDRQGFAHMFEHMMFRGTDRLGPTAHMDLIKRTGGDANAYTDFDHTVYVQELPADQLELALWLEAERMAFLKIDQESFDTERKVVEEERRQGLNRPYGTVLERALPAVFPGHPYGWAPIGRIPHLRSASVAELRAFWQRWYVPNNAALVIVGDVAHERAQALAERSFGWIPRGEPPPRVGAPRPPQPRAEPLVLTEAKCPAPAVGLVVRTVPTAHRDRTALRLLASILGQGESSRLYRDLVAGGAAPFIYAGHWELAQDGAMLAAAVLPPLGGDIAKAEERLRAQLRRLRDEPVAAEELAKAKRQALKAWVEQTLTVAGKAQRIGAAALHEEGLGRVAGERAEIEAASVEDLQRVARAWLGDERTLVVRVQRGGVLGMLFGGDAGAGEDAAPITAAREEQAPPPGRTGAQRPAGWPAAAPIAAPRPVDPTPRFVERRLANGLPLLVVENHEVPVVSIRLGLRRGDWSAEKPAVATIAAQCLAKGTVARGAGELARLLEGEGIDLAGWASYDDAGADVSALSDRFERAMELLAEAVRTPAFAEDQVALVVAQARTGLAVSAVTPEYLATRALRRALYGAHPYGRSVEGEPEDLDRIAPEDLRAWWSRAAQPAHAALVVAGDVDADRAQAAAERAFGGWAATSAAELPPPPAPPALGATRVVLVDMPGAQSQIRVGSAAFPRGDARQGVGAVIEDYFGDGFGSRLNQRIRVQAGLTYGAWAGFGSRRFAGSFQCGTFSKVETTAQALELVLDELKRLRDVPPTAQELADAQSSIVGGFARRRETPQQVADALWSLRRDGLPDDWYGRYLAAVAAADAEACATLARQVVDPGRLAIVVVGPAAQLAERLRAIAPVEVQPAAPAAAPPTGR